MNIKDMSQEEILNQYIKYWIRLDEMFNNGSGESEEAEKLRDEMDPLWYAMNPETIEKVNKFHTENEN